MPVDLAYVTPVGLTPWVYLPTGSEPCALGLRPDVSAVRTDSMYAQPTTLRVSALYFGVGGTGWHWWGDWGLGRASGEGGGACSRGGVSDVAWVAGANADGENVAHAAASSRGHWGK